MRPVLFRWRGFTFKSYPVMLYVGLLAGVAAGNIAAHAARLDGLSAYIANIVLIFVALLGSRLLYVAIHLPLRSNFHDVWGREQGGYCMYGGLPAALLVSIPVLRTLRLELGRFWDVAIFTILVGMVFARLGCLMNGCCCGRVSRNWMAFVLPNSLGVRARRIPTQILEALLGATLLLCAMFFRRQVVIPGTLFLMVVAAYATGRFILEFAREKERETVRLSSAQWISVVAFVCSGSALAICWST